MTIPTYKVTVADQQGIVLDSWDIPYDSTAPTGDLGLSSVDDAQEGISDEITKHRNRKESNQ